nr:unnamed protein product [Spirometra erinaceieuropaei]
MSTTCSAAGAVGTSFVNSSVSTKALREEIVSLEEVSRHLFLELHNLRCAQERIEFSRTLKGRYFNFLGYFFCVYCIWKIFVSTINILFNRVGLQDPITRGIDIAVHYFGFEFNVKFWSQQISFWLVGVIVVTSIRGLLITLTKFFYAIASTKSSNVIVLLIAHIMGTYFLSSVVLLRMNMTAEYRTILTQILGDLQFHFYHRWFDVIFLLSGLCILFIKLHTMESMQNKVGKSSPRLIDYLLHESCRPRFAGRQTVWSAITGGTPKISHPAVKKSIDEIDTWILRLLSTPSPVAGRTCVKVFLEPPEFGEPVIFALPDKNRFSLVDFPLQLPLKLLGPQKFLKVLFALLLEQKVLLQSSHCSRLTTCVMSLTALLYPLQYLFAAIPLLPSSLYGAEQLLQAPSPYIIGLPRSFLGSRFSFRLPRDVLLVDLDTQELYGTSAQEAIPKMPLTEEKFLIENLNKILQRAEAMDALDGDPELEDSKLQAEDPPEFSEGFDPLSYNADQDSINVALRVAMVEVFRTVNEFKDLSGSLGDSQADTDTSLTSNDNVKEKTSSPNIIDSAFERPAFWKVNSISSTEDYEDLQAGQPVPARLRDYYTPPTAHVIPEPPPETASSRHLVSPLNSQSPTSRAASRTPRRREGSPTQQKHSRSSGAMANLGAIISSWFIDASKMHEELMDPEVRNHRLEIARAENQRFITDSWDHFKSFLWLFNHIAIGLQASSKPIGSTFIDSRGDIISPVGLASAYSGLFSSQSERERLTRGGISSGFLLLESAHTHYHLLPTRNSGIDNSLKSSGNVTMSMPATPFNAKSRIWGTSEKPSPASGTDELGMPKSSPASTPLPESEVSGGESNDGQNRFSSTPSPSLPLKRTQTRKSVVGGEVGGPDLSTPKNNLSTPSPPIDLHQTAPLGTPDGISMKMVEDIVLFPPFKSSRSLGFRYYKGRLLQTAAEPKNVMGKIPPHVSVPALRSNISGIYGAKSFGENNPDATVKAASSSLSASVERPTSASVVTNVEASTKSPKSSVGWTYLFEEALLNSTDSKLWTNMQFWEDMFLDTVTQEREILGLDFGPADLLQHYSDLDAVDRKRLELQEDCLLANTLHNLIAFMVMARVSLEQIRRKARRILAKSHTGLHYTQKISKLLDCLECLRGNDIDLVPPLSRQLIHDVYLVGSVWQNTIEMTYLEIYSEFLILRYPEGPLIRRWWFDQIINFTHPPNSDMVCLQTVVRGKRAHFTFKSETAHQLFRAIASAIKEAASKRQRGQLLTSLGAEVNAVDVDTNAAVVIRFTHMDFCLHYGDDFKTIPLEMIKRCYISADDIFSVEAFDPLNRLPFDGHFKTDLALVLLKQWERLIGVAVARRQAGILSGTVTPLTSRSSNNSVLGLEVGE